MISDLEAGVRHLKDSGDGSKLVAAIPYMRMLGLRFSVDDGALKGHMPFAPHLIGNGTIPALHGGTVGALLECTAILQIFWEAQAEIVPKVVNIHVDYLRSGKAEDTWASCTITKHGRRIINVRARWPGSPIPTS